jgi:SAM-dependent methyltransferase
VLDVGCGKGAVAVQLACDIGCRVHALDAFAPFIESARDLARRRGVTRRCTFEVADLRRVPRSRRFDAALMIGVRPLHDAAPRLRSLVRPGGLYVIDDAVQLGRPPPDAHALTPEQADALIAATGDRVLERRLSTPSAIGDMNDRIYARLAARARELAAQHPRLRPALRELLRRQRRSNRLLTGPLRPCLWIVQRSR